MMSPDDRAYVLRALTMALGALKAVQTEFDKLEDVVTIVSKAIAIVGEKEAHLRVVEKEGR